MKKYQYIILVLVFTISAGLAGSQFIFDKFNINEDLKNVQAATINGLDEYLPVILKGELRETIFGVEMYDMTSGGGLYKMNNIGITWIRHNFLWSDPPANTLIWTAVEPSKGTRDWGAISQLDKELKNASELDKKVILIVRSTPVWARVDSNSPCGAIKPGEYAAFGNFMYDAVKRYSVPPYNVKFWELYNEPDFPNNTNNPPYGDPHGCWGDSGDPYNNGQAYGEMLKVVYPKIKDADPEAEVLVGGLLLDCDPRPNSYEPGKSVCDIHNPSYTSQPNFLEGILLAGAGNSFDGVSFHAYDYYQYWIGGFGVFNNDGWNTAWDTTGPVVKAKTEFVKEVLNEYSVTGKDLYNTESAILNTSDEFAQAGICKPFNINYENTKASHLVQSYTFAKALGLRANIYFHTKGWRCSALIEQDGTPIQPVYDTYSFASQTLGHTSFVKEISDYGSKVMAYEFDHDDSDRVFWVIWSLDGSNPTISLPSKPSHIYYFDGTPQTVTGTSFTVKLEPQYIEFY